MVVSLAHVRKKRKLEENKLIFKVEGVGKEMMASISTAGGNLLSEYSQFKGYG